MSLRLILLLLAALAFTSLGGAMFYYKASAATAQAEAQMAKADRDRAVAANKVQQETIARMQATEAENAKRVAELLDEIDAIRKGVDDTNKGIGDLKNADPKVRDFLDSAVPAGVDSLLNHQ